MKRVLAATVYSVLGGILTLCVLLLLQATRGLQALRDINDHYAAVLGVGPGGQTLFSWGARGEAFLWFLLVIEERCARHTLRGGYPLSRE